MNNQKKVDASKSGLKKYSIDISALCYGSADVIAHSEEEAKALVPKAEIRFYDWEFTDMEVSNVSEIHTVCSSKESIPDGYSKHLITEPLILEPEDWTAEEWRTLCKLGGNLPPERTQRIVFHAGLMETYLSAKSDILAPASTGTDKDREDRTYIVTEMCPSCMNEVEMRWNTDTMGFKAFCPICGERLMLCDECRHLPDAGPCDYDSKSDACRYNCSGCNISGTC